MAGQHMEREARYAETRMTTAEREQEIWKLHNLNWTQREIAFRLGITQPAVCHALKRLKGVERHRSTARCSVCKTEWGISELVDGLCIDCEVD